MIRPEGLKLLTNSRMRAFRRCPRLHYLLYDLGWRSTAESDALRFGSLMHEALEAWWIEHIIDDVERAKHWERVIRRGGGAIDMVVPAERRPLVEALRAVYFAAADPYMKARARAAMRCYHEQWSPRMAQYRVRAVEVEFCVPLRNPDTGRASRTWALAGKIDVLIDDVDAGVTMPVEHKTTARDISSGGRYWKRLRLDGQLSQYIRGAGELVGETIDRAGYDVVHRPGERPAKATPVEERKYTIAKTVKGEFQPSRLYAGQSERDETPEEFEERVYHSMRDKSSERLIRDVVTRAPEELAAHEADTWSQALLMHEAARNNGALAVRNVDACDGEDGSCDFLDVCYYGMEQLDDRTKFRRVANVHEELFDLSEVPEIFIEDTASDQEIPELP